MTKQDYDNLGKFLATNGTEKMMIFGSDSSAVARQTLNGSRTDWFDPTYVSVVAHTSSANLISRTLFGVNLQNIAAITVGSWQPLMAFAVYDTKSLISINFISNTQVNTHSANSTLPMQLNVWAFKTALPVNTTTIYQVDLLFALSYDGRPKTLTYNMTPTYSFRRFLVPNGQVSGYHYTPKYIGRVIYQYTDAVPLGQDAYVISKGFYTGTECGELHHGIHYYFDGDSDENRQTVFDAVGKAWSEQKDPNLITCRSLAATEFTYIYGNLLDARSVGLCQTGIFSPDPPLLHYFDNTNEVWDQLVDFQTS